MNASLAGGAQGVAWRIVMNGIKSFNDRIEFEVGENKVDRIVVDFAVTFEIDNEPRLSIRVEGGFRMCLADRVLELDPDDHSTLGPALSLFGKKLEKVVAFHDGRLELSFVNVGSVVVDALSMYEAWQISTETGVLVVCMPGGELAVWDNANAKEVDENALVKLRGLLQSLPDTPLVQRLKRLLFLNK
jgi:hypothetical protein